MGLGKLVKKALRSIAKPFENVAKGLKPDVPEAPKPPAPPVEVAPEKEAEVDEGAQTESGRKKAQSSGKRSLSVARSSGGGVNI